MESEPWTGVEQSAPVRSSIVYVIHGDGGYAYYDAGMELRANEEALRGAHAAAKTNTASEVFIFHQKPRQRFLNVLWPRDDGDFHYYRNGKLIARESYRRMFGSSRFVPEVTLHDRFKSSQDTTTARVFLYFGHEIPDFGGSGYDASHRKESFTMGDLALGLQGFAFFDLVVLSTCFNGTPHAVSALAPYADYIVASPDNLHLSYFDSAPLQALGQRPETVDVGRFAETFAQHAFNVLATDIQTAVTVAVYDVALSSVYANVVAEQYINAAGSASEHYDCAENPSFVRSGMDAGVKVHFRPARFGRNQLKAEHSGWQCFGQPPAE